MPVMHGRYVDHLLEALRHRELFVHIELAPLHFWCVPSPGCYPLPRSRT